jgi:hypothetical protein
MADMLMIENDGILEITPRLLAKLETLMKKFLAVALAVLLLPVYAVVGEPSKASESAYNTDIRKATTSTGLTKADLAWHAVNTYGWDCSEVVAKGEPTPEGYFIITCANGTKLRVYPRERQHPRITNIKGGYD